MWFNYCKKLKFLSIKLYMSYLIKNINKCKTLYPFINNGFKLKLQNIYSEYISRLWGFGVLGMNEILEDTNNVLNLKK